MTAPDRDPVVAAFEAILGWTSSPEIGGLVEDALPLARAQAALVAAVEDTEGACQNCLMLSGFLSACIVHAALADYRRALEAM